VGAEDAANSRLAWLRVTSSLGPLTPQTLSRGHPLEAPKIFNDLKKELKG
jgi:hypothetical protein